MPELAVIGCGYVGAVTAACFAHLGHRVTAIDLDQKRVELLQSGKSPIHEPGLEQLLRDGIAQNTLHFTGEYPEVLDAEIVFVAVDTPGSTEGAADLGAVRAAVAMVSPILKPNTVIVNKSTVPVGTAELVQTIARRHGPPSTAVVSNPEFLREGSAVHDFLFPDRVILGSDDPDALDRVASLYKAIRTTVHKVDTRTAETIKYASNAFLATKISFINEMAAVCEALGADVVEVAKGMGMDSRIGGQFLSAGLGWGGSCFPKDVKALAHMAAVHGTHPQLLRSVMDINSNQRLRAVQKLRKALGTLDGRYVLVLGAAFKGGTDDIRQSPSIDVARLLMLEGARLVIHDPVVTAEALATELPGPQLVNDVLKGARGVDAIVLATDWADYRDLPLKTMRELALGSTLLDTRNFLDPDSVRAAGFDYLCLGRPNVEGRGAERTDARPAPDLAPVAGL